MAHKLNNAALDPTNVQRMSAKLFLSIFHESTLNALSFFAGRDYPLREDTATFVKMVLN